MYRTSSHYQATARPDFSFELVKLPSLELRDSQVITPGPEREAVGGPRRVIRARINRSIVRNRPIGDCQANVRFDFLRFQLFRCSHTDPALAQAVSASVEVHEYLVWTAADSRGESDSLLS